jgi:hypothetical protein
MNPIKPDAIHGARFKAPELLANSKGPHDGEKLDVFAAACVLVFIFTLKPFSNSEQANSLVY